MHFFTSIHCTTKMHCKACRSNTPAGDKFRADMMARFGDIQEQNFTCPHGRPWGFVGLGDRVAAVAHPIARAIDRMLGTDLKNCGSCAERKAKLNALS